MDLNTQSAGEEIANSVLHGIGGLLGIAGLVLLVHQARSSLPVYVIFSSAMILMFTASAVYHALSPGITSQGAWKPQQASSKTALIELFRTFDHQAIYIFIAGTYTPFCILALKGKLGWALLVFEWALALTGIILSALKVRFLKKRRWSFLFLWAGLLWRAVYRWRGFCRYRDSSCFLPEASFILPVLSFTGRARQRSLSLIPAPKETRSRKQKPGSGDTALMWCGISLFWPEQPVTGFQFGFSAVSNKDWRPQYPLLYPIHVLFLHL